MVLDQEGRPRYVGERKAAIAAWFSESIHAMSNIDLTESGVFGPGYREG
jgi:N-acyl homoserine lactone hydrolase